MAENRNITGNIGLFYVCYELSKRNWNAMPTIRNSKGPDIIAIKDNIAIGIQVKSLSIKGDVWLGKHYQEPYVHFWFVVTNCRSGEPLVYIIPSEDIKTDRNDTNNQNNGLITFDWPKQEGEEPSTYYINHTFLKNSDKYINNWELLDSVQTALIADIRRTERL